MHHITEIKSLVSRAVRRNQPMLRTGTRLRSCAVAACGWTHCGTNPTSDTDCYLRMKTLLLQLDFSLFGSVKAPPRNGWRGRPARERGLMRTVLWYSSCCNSASGPAHPFCTEGHARQDVRSRQQVTTHLPLA